MGRDRLTGVGRDQQRVPVRRRLGGDIGRDRVRCTGPIVDTKGCLSASVSFSQSMRATMSVPPPAGAPTMSRTGLVG
jgi:hypothetical protein